MENEHADFIIRLIKFWLTNKPNFCFLRLEELWGPHTVDCWNNLYTAELQILFLFLEPVDNRGRRFCSKSRIWEPFSGSSGTACWSRRPLYGSPEGEGYHHDTTMAFVQFLASSYK